MKTNKLNSTLLLLMFAGYALASSLTTQTDSLNYAIGLHNGINLRQQYDILAQPKAQETLLKSVDNAFTKNEIPDEKNRMGREIAVMFAQQQDKGLAEIKAWGFNSKVCLQGLVNALNGDTVWKVNEAYEFFQNHYNIAVSDTNAAPAKHNKQKMVCPTKAAPIKLKTTNDSLNYAFGLINGEQIRSMIQKTDIDQLISTINNGLSNYNQYSQIEFIGETIGYALINQRNQGLMGFQDINLVYPVVRNGLWAGINNDSIVFTLESATAYINNILSRKQAQKEAEIFMKIKSDGEYFLALNAQRKEVTTTPSGLQYEILQEGKGTEHPTANSRVKVHYHGTTIDGKVFDSSVERGEPIVLPLNGVISGWTEGVQLMTVGAKYRLYLPYQLAYGERGAGEHIPPYSALIFDIELLEIEN